MEVIDARLTNIFRDVFDDPTLELSEDLARGDWAAWDSLAHVKLVLAIEEEYGIKISFDQVANVRTVSDVKRLIDAG